jgi:Flp pilus assembly protein TadD
MKSRFLILLFTLMATISFAQQKETAEKLVDEGVALHDKGDPDGAIKLYNQALELDKDNLLALTEKAYSLLAQEKLDECIKNCWKAFETHPKESGLKSVYVTFGNALDAKKETDKALQAYNEGIALFPDYYQLHYNKGVTLSAANKMDEAIESFQKAATFNPEHASSHNALGRFADFKKQKIPAILAYCRFLSIEPQSSRAKENLSALLLLMKGNVEKTGENAVTINISPDLLDDGNKKGKAKVNNFSSTELILSMSSSLDYHDQYKNNTAVEKFIRKMETICSSLDETQKNNSGFYWEYYAPYFIEMKKNNLVETFSYIAFASTENVDVANWLKNHSSETDHFYEWSNAFSFKSSRR